MFSRDSSLGAFAFLQGLQHPGHAVAPLEESRAGQEVALLGEEQEDDAHHDSDGGVVDLAGVIGQRIGPLVPDGRAPGLGEGGHEQLDGPAHLDAEGLGDLLRREDRLGEEGGKTVLLLASQQTSDAQQLDEGVSSLGLLDPGEGIDDPRGEHRAGCGRDEGPPAPVGDHSDGAGRVGGAQHRLHAVDRARRPGTGQDLAQVVHRVDHEHECTHTPLDRERTGRGHLLTSVRGGGGVGGAQGPGGRVAVLAPAEDVPQDGAHPGVAGLAVCGEGIRYCCCIRGGRPARDFARLLVCVPGPVEGGLGVAQSLAGAGGGGGDAIGVDAPEGRRGEEGAVGVHEGEPGPVHASGLGGRGSPACGTHAVRSSSSVACQAAASASLTAKTRTTPET